MRMHHACNGMVRAASSGDELDVSSAKLAETAVIFIFFFFQAHEEQDASCNGMASLIGLIISYYGSCETSEDITLQSRTDQYLAATATMHAHAEVIHIV